MRHGSQRNTVVQDLNSSHISRLTANPAFLRRFPEFKSAAAILAKPGRKGCRKCDKERNTVVERILRNGIRKMDDQSLEKVKLFLGIKGQLSVSYTPPSSRNLRGRRLR